MGELSGKTAVITGGGTGIGKEIALRFHQEGAAVVLCGRRKEVLETAAAEIPGDRSRILTRKADVTSDREIDELIEAVIDRFGRIDILVNNAGIMRFGSVEEASIELWEQIMQTNLYGPWRVMTKIVPIMRKQGGGSMVNISSIAGHKALPNAGVYCTSKASLQMLSQVAALEWAKDRIRVNLIAPGLVESTELADPIFGKENVQDFYAKLREPAPPRAQRHALRHRGSGALFRLRTEFLGYRSAAPAGRRSPPGNQPSAGVAGRLTPRWRFSRFPRRPVPPPGRSAPGSSARP